MGSAIFFATIFAWIAGAVILLVAAFALIVGFTSKTRIAISGPAGGKHSAFVEMTDREMQFMVSDRPWKWNSVNLGSLSTENPQALEGFCWSADGSVIARATGRPADPRSFSVAYDFQEHELVKPEDARNLQQSHDLITSLLAQRGGQGPLLGKIEATGQAPLPIGSWLLPGGILLAGASISWGMIGGRRGRFHR